MGEGCFSIEILSFPSPHGENPASALRTSGKLVISVPAWGKHTPVASALGCESHFRPRMGKTNRKTIPRRSSGSFPSPHGENYITVVSECGNRSFPSPHGENVIHGGKYCIIIVISVPAWGKLLRVNLYQGAHGHFRPRMGKTLI